MHDHVYRQFRGKDASTCWCVICGKQKESK